jgi:hypothetical protein
MGHTKKNRKPIPDMTPDQLREELDKCQAVAEITPNPEIRKSLEKRIREIQVRLTTVT